MQRRASAPDNEHERILAALRDSPATKRAVLSSLLRAYDDAPSLLDLEEHRDVLQFAERHANRSGRRPSRKSLGSLLSPRRSSSPAPIEPGRSDTPPPSEAPRKSLLGRSSAPSSDAELPSILEATSSKELPPLASVASSGEAVGQRASEDAAGELYPTSSALSEVSLLSKEEVTHRRLSQINDQKRASLFGSCDSSPSGRDSPSPSVGDDSARVSGAAAAAPPPKFRPPPSKAEAALRGEMKEAV